MWTCRDSFHAPWDFTHRTRGRFKVLCTEKAKKARWTWYCPSFSIDRAVAFWLIELKWRQKHSRIYKPKENMITISDYSLHIPAPRSPPRLVVSSNHALWCSPLRQLTQYGMRWKPVNPQISCAITPTRRTTIPNHKENALKPPCMGSLLLYQPRLTLFRLVSLQWCIPLEFFLNTSAIMIPPDFSLPVVAILSRFSSAFHWGPL